MPQTTCMVSNFALRQNSKFLVTLIQICRRLFDSKMLPTRSIANPSTTARDLYISQRFQLENSL